jgi:hypothetical protein
LPVDTAEEAYALSREIWDKEIFEGNIYVDVRIARVKK